MVCVSEKLSFTKRKTYRRTVANVRSAIDDGRPCAMDVFAAALQDDCDDPFDRWEAIVEWLHGDWDAAFSFLEDETRARIAPEHKLYKTGDADAPDAIKDRNGEVVLRLCRSCGKGEAELVERYCNGADP